MLFPTIRHFCCHCGDCGGTGIDSCDLTGGGNHILCNEEEKEDGSNSNKVCFDKLLSFF